MTPSICDVPGFLVGHAQDSDALTGVTVVLCPAGAVAGVDVRGGAPGTRETDLMRPENSVQEVHAVALCGGSAFGLEAASGVVSWLHERGYGFDVQITRVPIVPAAVIFDLVVGRSDRWPDRAMGYAACEAAGSTVAEGCVGAGIGASVGKIVGVRAAMKAGVGSWSERLPDGTTVGALAVVNAWGDVCDEQGRIIAGARAADGGFLNTMRMLRDAGFGAMAATVAEMGNTTLAVVATDALLSKAEATKLAQMAHDGLARSIRPVHTPFDGDSVFALASGRRVATHLLALGAVAADVLSRAIERAVQMAVPLGGLPAAGEG